MSKTIHSGIEREPGFRRGIARAAGADLLDRARLVPSGGGVPGA